MEDALKLILSHAKKSKLRILKLNPMPTKKKLRVLMKVTMMQMGKLMLKFQCEDLNVKTKELFLLVMGII